MAMDHCLSFRAGPKALAKIRRDGLQPQDIAVIPGAAGGPKALGIIGLDTALFGEWLPRAPRTRDLIGASIGSWRFAAVCRGDVLAAFKDFGDIYCGQRYPLRPSLRMVSESAHTNTMQLLGGRESTVLAHPHYRLHVVATRGRGPLSWQSRLGTAAGFASAALVNMLGRQHLRHLAERVWFHDPRGLPALLQPTRHTDHADAGAGIAFDTFKTLPVPLSVTNLHPALWASAAIPMVMEGVNDIDGAPPGPYWDGGIIDYNLHLPYHRADGITLFPHFSDRIIPGWLDKPMPWRRERGAWLENMLLVSPSCAYLDSLPHKKLPDRTDFKTFENDYDRRHHYWRQAMAESDRLGAAFLDAVDTGQISALVTPL